MLLLVEIGILYIKMSILYAVFSHELTHLENYTSYHVVIHIQQAIGILM